MYMFVRGFNYSKQHLRILALAFVLVMFYVYAICVTYNTYDLTFREYRPGIALRI